jgi:hypothetical protein
MVRLIGVVDGPDGFGDDDGSEFVEDEFELGVEAVFEVEGGFGVEAEDEVVVLGTAVLRFDRGRADAGVIGGSSASRVGAPAPKVFTGAAPSDECAR